MAQPSERSSPGIAAFGAAALRYWLGVYPKVRREAHQWQLRAQTIASPGLRAAAQQNLAGERLNLEGAAAFATFAARPRRSGVIRGHVAFQAAYDYADTLAETQSCDQARNAQRLHTALLVAVTAEMAHRDYYEHHTERDDGGYLAALADTTRESILSLPSYEAISQTLCDGAERIVQYQSQMLDPPRLRAWALTHVDGALLWWEAAAACGSSLAVFALITAATKPGLDRHDPTNIDRAYSPICALHTLLDSLIDYTEDDAAGQRSLLDYYDSMPALVTRLTWLADEARRQAQALPGGHQHTLILAGMVSLYLSSADATLPSLRSARTPLIRAIGRPIWLTLAIFHAHRLRTAAQSRREYCTVAHHGVSATISRPG